ncbi:hypothetical protein LSTR_LSTR012388 [Laodelphax striatellus]|uniref:Uncharacterized protein n=1 Tax=Laodelphax striatellus TaxID=195883 RepID=A0A482XK20_LAOST|nr:hypothetical protein LSTR_LSTR012388 [Laodelphax striatellus]
MNFTFGNYMKRGNQCPMWTALSLAGIIPAAPAIYMCELTMVEVIEGGTKKAEESKLGWWRMEEELGLGNQTRLRMPLDDFDPNSQDSGISCGSLDDSNKPFRFAAPSGVAPRKLSHNELSQSPRRFLTQSSNSSGGNSHCSIESLDDNFMDMLQNDKLMDDENAQLPSGLSSLLTDPILRHGDENARASISPGKQSNDNSPFMLRGPISFRRCLSENINNHNTVSTACEGNFTRAQWSMEDAVDSSKKGGESDTCTGRKERENMTRNQFRGQE